MKLIGLKNLFISSNVLVFLDVVFDLLFQIVFDKSLELIFEIID